jgi:hypothetical protein
LAAALAGAGAALILGLLPFNGDAPAHLYRTLLVHQGVHIWDNLWFAGDYPLASYSGLYYVPAALVGNLPIAVAAVVVTAALFASLVVREWGSLASWPARAFAICAAGTLVTGTYPYAAGFAAVIATLRSLQAGKSWLALGLAALTLALSPLAFAFLLVALLAVALVQKRVGRKVIVVGVWVAALAGVQLLALFIFPEKSIYPANSWDLLGVLTVTTLGTLLASRSERGRLLVVFFALWGLASIAAYLIPSPVGDNVTRLRYVVFPLVLLAAFLVSFRPRWLAAAAVTCALAYNVVPYLGDIPLHSYPQATQSGFWAPTIRYLDGNLGGDYRVEVVPTIDHWESYWLAGAGVPLARGWFRQIDYADNRLLYGSSLTPSSYTAWLRGLGVRFVVLPLTRLDRLGSSAEANLLRSGHSGLEVVSRTPTTVIYQLPDATPILTPSTSAVVTSMQHETISGFTQAPGVYTLRVRYTPFWHVQTGDVCVSQLASGMTRLSVRRPGRFELVLPEEPGAIVASVFRDGDTECGKPAG